MVILNGGWAYNRRWAQLWDVCLLLQTWTGVVAYNSIHTIVSESSEVGASLCLLKDREKLPSTFEGCGLNGVS